MSAPKFKVGQMVVLLSGAHPRCIAKHGDLTGRIDTIKKIMPPYRGRVYYMLETLRLTAIETLLKPIDPPGKDTELGDWNTITQLLGVDIRQSAIERAILKLEKIL